MKLLTLLLAIFTWVFSVASARAPLLGRSVGETVESNYIVVLKQGIPAEEAKGYYHSLRTSPRKFGKSKRGIVREFQNIAGMQAAHVECDEDMLDSIRQNPQVRNRGQSPHCGRGSPVWGKRETGRLAYTWQVDYVARDERIAAQNTVVSHVVEKRATAALDQPWGLGRISHREPGTLAYVNTRPPPTRLYVLDTGIRLSHEVRKSNGKPGVERK